MYLALLTSAGILENWILGADNKYCITYRGRSIHYCWILLKRKTKTKRKVGQGAATDGL